MKRVLYFGAIDRPGHYLVEHGGPVLQKNHDIPWKYNELDMVLCPRVVRKSYGPTAERCDQIEGLAKLHHRLGWTALSFWDRSVDTRYNCNSTFIIEGCHNFDVSCRMAKKAYPSIWNRYKFSIYLDMDWPVV